jgi:hypothetical protein
MVLIMAFGIMMAIGMAYDGGGELDTQIRANKIAEEAARAGATAVDVNAYMATGVAQIDPLRATNIVLAYCAASGVPQLSCTPIIGPSRTEIQVNVSIVRNIVFLPTAVGKTVYGHAQVKLTQGVTDAGG